MVLITTSRHPTMGARILSKELKLVLPHALRVNRGKSNFNEILIKAIELEKKAIVIVESGKPKPKKIDILEINEFGKIVSKIEFQIKDFLSKNKITNKKVPFIDKYYLYIEDIITVEFKEILTKLTEILEILKVTDKTFKEIKGIVLYFGVKEKQIFLTFYLVPEKIEIGPKIYLKKTAWSNNY